MEVPLPAPNNNDELKIKPMLKEYTPVTALIKGEWVDESISSKSSELFTNFMNSIIKHNQLGLIDFVVDKRVRNNPPSMNKIKTNLSPMTLQSEPPANNLEIPVSTPEVGGQKRGRTSKQMVKTKTQSKKNKK
jgi:hypothetical protein